MTSVRPIRARVRLIGFIFLVAVQGCAHTPPPSPLPESLQQQLGEIGVVAITTEGQQAFGSPGTGRLSNIGRGAGLGAAIGAGIGAQGGMLAPFAAAGGAVLGLAVGTLHGAVASESWQKAETTFRTIVAELDLNHLLPQHLVAFAQAKGYVMTHLIVLQDGPQQQSRYATARGEGIDTVLEIQDLTVNLVPAEYMVNPHRSLTLSARVQLIRTVDQTLLDDRVVTDKLGPPLLLDRWTANQATRFRQEVQQATERLAEQIITDYFMLYRFPERVSYSGGFLDVHLKGLNRNSPGEYPDHFGHKTVQEKDIRAKYGWVDFPVPSPRIPAEFIFMAAGRVESLQPTMSWEPFPGSNATYDLKIWRAGRLGPDTLVYSRTNLDQPTHTIETALEPSSLYYWSVRAHFVEQGRERITDWSRRSVTYGLMLKIMTLGFWAFMPDPVAEGFFVFITPPSQSAKSAEAQTQ
jgi:hypothetical protein